MAFDALGKYWNHRTPQERQAFLSNNTNLAVMVTANVALSEADWKALRLPVKIIHELEFDCRGDVMVTYSESQQPGSAPSSSSASSAASTASAIPSEARMRFGEIKKNRFA